MAKIGDWLLALVLLAGGALCASAWWGGLRAEREYRAIVSRLEATSPSAVAAVRYERGWLSSTAEVELPGRPATRRKPGWQVVVRHTLYHGPIPIGDLAAGLEVLRPVAARLRGEVVLVETSVDRQERSLGSARFDGTVALDGRIETRLAAPALQEISLSGGLELEWQGLEATFHTRREGDFVTGDLSGESVRVQVGGITCTLSSLRSHFDYRLAAHGLWIGDSRLDVDRIGFDGLHDGELPARMERVRLETTQALEDDGVSYGWTLGFESLVGSPVWTGPGSLSLTVQRLDPAVVARLEAAAGIRRAGAADAPEAGEVAEVQQLLGLLVQGSPGLETELRLGSASGELHLGLRMGVDGSRYIPGMNLLGWSSVVVGDLDLFLPRAVVEMALDRFGAAMKGVVAVADTPLVSPRERLDELLRQGLVVMKPGGFAVRARLQGGKLDVNGRPLALDGTSLR